MALWREDLDQATCQRPGCDHTAHDGLWLHGRCHIEAPAKAEYQPKTGKLRLICATCSELICEIVVARRDKGD